MASNPSSRTCKKPVTLPSLTSARYSTIEPLTPSARDDGETNDLEDHVIMAVDKASNGKVGCAYYIARHELLCCMQDIEQGEYEVIETLKVEIEPTTLILSIRIEEALTQEAIFQNRHLGEGTTQEHGTPPWEVVSRPESDYGYDNAINKLMNIKSLCNDNAIRFLVPGDNLDYNVVDQTEQHNSVEHQGRLLTISSNLELNNRSSIGCIGAVINYLQRRRAIEYVQNDQRAELAYRISRLEMFTLRSTMLLSPETLSSLQIIQSENHPSIANQGPSASRSKESLSIYGLFQKFARTPQGKSNLRRIFLRPCLEANIITNRHDLISVLIRPEHQSVCDSLSKSLSRLKNMQSIVISLRKGIERGNQKSGTIRSSVWAALLEFCYHSIDIGETVRAGVIGYRNFKVLTDIDNVLDKTLLQHLGKMVHDIVDLDECMEQRRTVVKCGVSDELDTIKEFYERMEEGLTRIATELTNRMPVNFRHKLNVVFIPQLGFHVTVPLDNISKDPSWEGDETWERRFRTEMHQYYKNDKMRAMDEQWGDIHVLICDAEIEISHRLAQQILQHETWLVKASNVCGELDSLLALTHGARHYRLTRPRMVQQNIIDIKGGRHILQELTVPAYISNDTFLVGGDDYQERPAPSMMILTGPNYSGKSIYMKQVALIVYMAQIGSFVPADAADLGITDKILTRISTAETVSKIHSAFAIDLQQVALALKSCTNRSLVVIDEFGRGTNSCDGAGLAAGVLTYLASLGSESPKVLTSTHFHEIFNIGKFDYGTSLTFAHLDVLFDSCVHPTGQITYLYNLRQGRSTLSYGSQCAAMNGIPERVLNRGTLLAELATQAEDLVSICATLSQAEIEELESAETACRMFLMENLNDVCIDVGAILELCLAGSANTSTALMEGSI